MADSESPARKAVAQRLNAASPRGIPPILMKEMTDKFGQKVVANLTDSQLKIAGAVAQAGLENEQNKFTTQRQKAFVGFLEV